MTISFRTWAWTAAMMVLGWGLAGGLVGYITRTHHHDWRDDPDVRCLKMPNHPPNGVLIGRIEGVHGETFYDIREDCTAPLVDGWPFRGMGIDRAVKCSRAVDEETQHAH